MESLINLGNQLTQAGITPTLLIALSTVLVVLFMLSTREFLAWFLKINKLVEIQIRTQKQIAELEDKISILQTSGKNIQHILESQTPQFPLAKAKNEEPLSLHTENSRPKEEWMSRPLL